MIYGHVSLSQNNNNHINNNNNNSNNNNNNNNDYYNLQILYTLFEPKINIFFQNTLNKDHQ